MGSKHLPFMPQDGADELSVALPNYQVAVHSIPPPPETWTSLPNTSAGREKEARWHPTDGDDVSEFTFKVRVPCSWFFL